ncbi:MAG: hypothetical protein H7X70_06580 [Candidatus Kapabacteria bacterium]|nr:hypothetical protein [Candidatus Kapabacteria bacterium]
MATTRTRVVELSEHTPTQVLLFGVIAISCSIVLFLFVAAPAMDAFFAAFLRSDVVRDGSRVTYRIAENRDDEIVVTGTFSTWALVDPHERKSVDAARLLSGDFASAPRYHAEYIFTPAVALAPLVIVGGFVLAGLLTTLATGLLGFVRQKIEREILNAMDRLAISQYGDHTPEEIKSITMDVLNSDLRRMHDLADTYGMPFTDLELLRGALRWRDSTGVTRAWRTHDAIKFYMREYFTDRYSNAVLGFVYIGAAILIIVIGIRGLKFLPSTDPSVVLGALGLEFMLLITYAMVLMYGRTDEEGIEIHRDLRSHAGAPDADAEHLLRAFLAVSRTSNTERKTS